MSSTSPRQGLSKTMRSMKTRYVVVFTLVLLTAVFSATALTANLNGPSGQQAGSFAANIFSMFGGSSVEPSASSASDDTVVVMKRTESKGDNGINAPAVCAAPPANMVAWYPGEVNTNDIIGDPPNNGAFQGTAFYLPGMVGNGFNLTGTNNIQVPPSTALNVGAAPNTGISIDAWINPANLTSAPIVEWNDATNVGVHFWHSVTAPGELYANIVDTAGGSHPINTSGAGITPGTFTYVAMTYDNATQAICFYVNGLSGCGNVGGGPFTPQTGAGYSMYIGRRPTGGGNNFVGIMDEVEIYNRVLTGAEQASIFGAGSDGKCHVSTIQFSTAAQSVNENAGTVTTVVKRVGANDSTATAAYNTAPGTALGGGVDYGNASTSTVTFSPGERTQNVTIPIIDDAIDEIDETFTAAISLPTGPGVSIGTPATQTITILDNDAPPNMTINNASGTEGTPPGAAGSATFTVTKTGATTFSSSVVVTPSNSSAAGGATCTTGIDFINTPTTLTFPASTTTDTQTVTVNFCADSDIEADEIFAMVLTPTGATAGGAGTGTIRDDDSSVQFTAATFSGTEGTIAGPGLTAFNISISRTSGGGTGLPAATVDASTIQVGGTAVGNNSCAIAGTDYVVVSGQTLAWGAGVVSTQNLVVQVCADSVDEGLDLLANGETFNSQLSNAIGTQIGTQAASQTTIIDDDAPPSFALSQDGGNNSTVNEGSLKTYTVTRSGSETALSTTVTWTTANGTAASPGDFAGGTGTVTFAAGTGGTQTFTIAANNDSLFEGTPNENYTVSLTAASNGSPFASGSPQTTQIVDQNTAPTVAINDVTQVELNSGQSAFIFTITRTGNAQANQTMTASTQDGGGTTAANAPSDYTAIAGDTVTFTQGQTSRQVAVIVNGDTTFEDDETFRVNLTNFNFGSATDGTGLGTITNDDAAPVFTLNADVTVTEGNGGSPPWTLATFTITKTGATQLTSIVSASTAPGTATAPADYNAIVNAQVATFAPGDTTKTFNVEVNRDSLFEGGMAATDENFTVTLNNVTNGTFGANITRSGLIDDDEAAPNFASVGTSLSNTEGTSATVTTTMNFPSGTTATAVSSTLSCTPTAGTASSGDFGSAQTLTFAAGAANGSSQVCSISTVDDTFFEAAETFTITVAGTSNTGTVTGGSFTATIVNNDGCTFVASNVAQNEGNAGTSNFVHNVTKACDSGSGNALVSYASSDGTAANPVDYTEIIPGTLAFLPATTSLPLPVSVNGDLTVEPDETYNVLLTGATVNGVAVPNGACGVAVCGLTNGLGTIVNDDGVPISISGTITNFGGGAAAGVVVNLTGSTVATTTTNASGFYTFTNLPSGGNFFVDPVEPGGTTASPLNRTYTGITASVANANFVLYGPAPFPRTLNVVNSFTNPGSPVTVPITLTAQGDEASLSFSLNYNPAILGSPVVACGVDSGAGCSLLANTTTPGVIGISVDPAGGGTWAAGTRIVVTVTFTTAPTAASNTPITFGDIPTLRRTSDLNANPLPTTYNNGFVVFGGQGLESDVAPRFAGNGSVVSDDVIQTRRFTTGLDTVNPAFNEFQRADSAPAGTKGDGQLGATDVIQARRYSVGLDPTQTAGGPTGPIPPAPAPEASVKGDKGKVETSVGRIWRILNSTGSPGTQVTNCTEIDSQNDEGGYQTTVNFDPMKVSISGVSSPATNPDVTLGTGAAAGSALTVNGNQANLGRIGFLVDSNTALVQGTRQVVCLRFTILPGTVGPTTVALSFGNVPTPGSMSDLNAGNLTYTTEPGQINILGPTAAGVSVSGRVTTPSGAGLRGATVVITDSEGVRRTATTSTFGYYQFEDIEVGNTYIIGVTSRRYRFAPRTLQVLDSLADVDFVGQE